MILTSLTNTQVLSYCRFLEVYNSILHDTTGDSLRFGPGGATQCTLQVAQWYLNQPGMVTAVGCVGGSRALIVPWLSGFFGSCAPHNYTITLSPRER